MCPISLEVKGEWFLGTFRGTREEVRSLDYGTLKSVLQSACLDERFPYKLVTDRLYETGWISNIRFDSDVKWILTEAIYFNHIGIFTVLIEKGGFDINSMLWIGLTPLSHAIACNCPEMVKMLINVGANVNMRNFKGHTPLCLACDKDNLEFAKMLIESGASLEASTKDGETPLLLACKKSNLELVKYLISKGADINAKTAFGTSVLCSAILYGSSELCKYLLEMGADPENFDAEQKNALDYALHDKFEIVKILVEERGMNIFKRSKNDMTTLHFAAMMDNFDCVKYLVERGVDVNVKNIVNETPLTGAVMNDNVEIAEYLISHGSELDNVSSKNGNTPLASACLTGLFNVARLLIEKGADIDAKDCDGLNILIMFMFVKLAHDPECAEAKEFFDFLIQKHKERGNLNSLGLLHIACEFNNKSVIKSLLEKGADPFSGHSVLFHIKDGAIMKQFLQYGLDVNLKNSGSDSVLIRVCHDGNVELLNILIENGADISVTGRTGQNALHVAIAEGNVEIVRRLLELGLDPNAPDLEGLLPSQKAILGYGRKYRTEYQENPEEFDEAGNSAPYLAILKLLKDAGVDLMARNANGKTCIDYILHPVQFVIADGLGGKSKKRVVKYGNDGPRVIVDTFPKEKEDCCCSVCMIQ